MAANGYLILASVLIMAVYLEYPQAGFSESLKRWINRGKFVSIGGRRVFYHDHTSKQPQQNNHTLLLLHGFPTSSYDWHKVWPDMESHFKRVIALDFIGYGLSEKPNKREEYTIERQANLVEKFLRELGVKDVHVLAHDVGDTVLQELLARANENTETDTSNVQADTFTIRTACFLNGGIFVETSHPRWSQRLLAVPYLGPVLCRFLNFQLFKVSFGEIFGTKSPPSEEELHHHWSLILFRNGHLVLSDLLQYMDQRVKHKERWSAALQKTSISMHFIYGPADPVNPPDFVPYIRSIIPNVSLHVLADDVGHYPQLEDPQAVTLSYLNFMARSRY